MDVIRLWCARLLTRPFLGDFFGGSAESRKYFHASSPFAWILKRVVDEAGRDGQLLQMSSLLPVASIRAIAPMRISWVGERSERLSIGYG
jgi:hypothetical protein